MNQDIVREVTLTLAITAPVVTHGWKWSPGVVLFPEALCPYCKEVVKSKALWVVRGQYLIGQAVPVKGRVLKLERPDHPHADRSNGAICMGNATDTLQALFNGLNPLSAYRPTDTWLQGKYWEHECDEMSAAGEDEFECDGCERVYSNDDSYSFNDSLYCNDCFSSRAFYCSICNDGAFSIDDRRETPHGDDVCYGCWNERYFECTACEKVLSRDEFMHDDECSDCYEYPNTCALEGCDAGFEDDDGYSCDDCSEKFCSRTCRGEHDCTWSECAFCSDMFNPESGGEYCIYCMKHYCNDCGADHKEQCPDSSEGAE